MSESCRWPRAGAEVLLLDSRIAEMLAADMPIAEAALIASKERILKEWKGNEIEQASFARNPVRLLAAYVRSCSRCKIPTYVKVHLLNDVTICCMQPDDNSGPEQCSSPFEVRMGIVERHFSLFSPLDVHA